MERIINYIDKIAKLPLKENYTPEEILTSDFLIARDGNMEIFYCSHNEYMNPYAKIFIVGITPGLQQMSKSIAAARRCMHENRSV